MAVNLNGVVKTDYRYRALIVDNCVNKDWRYSLRIFFSLFRCIYSSFIPFVPFFSCVDRVIEEEIFYSSNSS